MQRYFVSSINNNGNIILSKDDIFHILKVLRMKVGDKFEINDDGIIYLAEISILDPFKFSIIKTIDENRELLVNVTLLYCYPKKEHLEIALQKATELGVNKIVLVNSNYVDIRITNDNINKKFIRFNKIIKEAGEQSKRTVLPTIYDKVIDYREINKFKSDLNLIAYENSTSSTKLLKNYLENSRYKDISILVGPEGGFTKSEVSYALENDFKEISLGKTILRSETSVIYLLSVINYECGAKI
ncbi:MAG: 16S rRNA (uracil(1498)-N(3))-methyltransferase [Firmicutes bacterium]|uniref:Ribosomal RNA small subunit methyltransferase E n=1 Tax=Candidatus Onthovivens merdipullorum TaxID=2840889 RepID=A0A9D9DLJ7_9BACL|nr:16S rRNA (uracil(1498)-N(3))-methyltransferase [Candidatus Onthovivens merdipullorum]